MRDISIEAPKAGLGTVTIRGPRAYGGRKVGDAGGGAGYAFRGTQPPPGIGPFFGPLNKQRTDMKEY